MRHDKLWTNLVNRAVRQGGLDIQAFVDQAVDSGMSESAIQERLMNDLDTGGPIFGKFMRQVGAAAENTTLAAHRTGGSIGSALSDPDVEAALQMTKMERIIDVADPGALEEIERGIADRDERMWIAELRVTCHLCLPLHGTVRTMEEWREMGLHPDTIHANEGWSSKCYCQLVPVRETPRRTDVMAPLVRNKLKGVTGVKGAKKTYRGVTQVDLEKAVKARDKALESVAGRRTMRMLGQSKGETVERET